MGYQRTPAHYTASAAYHAGDGTWPGPSDLIIRRANVGGAWVPHYSAPTRPGGANLGDFEWAAELPELLKTAVTAGKAVYDIRTQQLADQRSRAQAQDATNAAAAAQTAAANQVAAAAAAAAGNPDTYVPGASLPGAGGKHGGGSLLSNPAVLVGGAAVGALLLVMLLRR